LPWERRHRRGFEHVGFFVVIGAIIVLAAVVTILNLPQPSIPSSLP